MFQGLAGIFLLELLFGMHGCGWLFFFLASARNVVSVVPGWHVLHPVLDFWRVPSELGFARRSDSGVGRCWPVMFLPY